MKTRSSFAAGVVLALLATGSSVATGASDTAVKKQRIAIEGTFNLAGGKFKLIPLTPGPLKQDSGRFQTAHSGIADNEVSFIRNGQKVSRSSGGVTDRMTGKNGTFSIASGSFEHVLAGGGDGILTGRWTFGSGTRAYEGLGGGGAFVAVMRLGPDSFRYEGYVRGA